MPKSSQSLFSPVYERDIVNLEKQYGMYHRAYYACDSNFISRDEEVMKLHKWLTDNVGAEFETWFTYTIVISPAGSHTFYKAYSFKSEHDATLFKLTWN